MNYFGLIKPKIIFKPKNETLGYVFEERRTKMPTIQQLVKNGRTRQKV
jgi:hypothetical protein